MDKSGWAYNACITSQIFTFGGRRGSAALTGKEDFIFLIWPGHGSNFSKTIQQMGIVGYNSQIGKCYCVLTVYTRYISLDLNIELFRLNQYVSVQKQLLLLSNDILDTVNSGLILPLKRSIVTLSGGWEKIWINIYLVILPRVRVLLYYKL